MDSTYSPIKFVGEIPQVFLENHKSITKSQFRKKNNSLSGIRQEFYANSNENLMHIYRSGNVYFNDSYSEYLNELFLRVIDSIPSELTNNINIHLTKYPTPKSFNLSKKAIFINIGLFNILENEVQLAFEIFKQLLHIKNKDNYKLFLKTRRNESKEEINDLGSLFKVKTQLENKLLSTTYLISQIEEANIGGEELLKQSNFRTEEAQRAAKLLAFDGEVDLKESFIDLKFLENETFTLDTSMIWESGKLRQFDSNNKIKELSYIEGEVIKVDSSIAIYDSIEITNDSIELEFLQKDSSDIDSLISEKLISDKSDSIALDSAEVSSSVPDSLVKIDALEMDSFVEFTIIKDIDSTAKTDSLTFDTVNNVLENTEIETDTIIDDTIKLEIIVPMEQTQNSKGNFDSIIIHIKNMMIDDENVLGSMEKDSLINLKDSLFILKSQNKTEILLENIPTKGIDTIQEIIADSIHIDTSIIVTVDTIRNHEDSIHVITVDDEREHNFFLNKFFFLELKEIANFERIEYYYNNGYYFESLFHGIIYHEKYPHNLYLKTKIAESLYKLFRIRKFGKEEKQLISPNDVESKKQYLLYFMANLENDEFGNLLMGYTETLLEQYPEDEYVKVMHAKSLSINGKRPQSKRLYKKIITPEGKHFLYAKNKSRK